MIIGLTGYAGSGKDTVANLLVQRGFTRVAFADRMKELTEDLYLSVRVANNVLGRERAKRRLPFVRRAYQRVGNSLRERVDPLVWIKALTDSDAFRAADHLVVSDVRYLNEADAIWEAGGVMVRVQRDGYGPINDHVSEIQAGQIRVDYTIHNTGNLDNLEECTALLLDVIRGPGLAHGVMGHTGHGPLLVSTSTKPERNK